MKSKYIFFYTFLLILSICPFFTTKPSSDQPEVFENEAYKIQFNNVNTIDKAIESIEKINSIENNKFDTVNYVFNSSEFVKRRFFHGQSSYYMCENWIAYLSGLLIWDHLSAIVEPDHILHYNKALCSQQSIVFMEILKRKGITTRWVGLGEKGKNGHFVNEVYYNCGWHLFDVNKEPDWNKVSVQHESAEYYKKNQAYLIKIYENKLDEQTLINLISHIHYGEPNQFPAKNMLMFHRITKWITYILPVFLASVLTFLLVKKSKKKS